MKDYKKILEGIVNIISNTEESYTISNICSYIGENCPELGIKVQDEKIREWLVGYFNQYATDGIKEFGNGLKVEDVIAWLEKQGEPKTEPTFLFKVKKDGKEYNVRGIFGDVSLELYDESESNPNHLIYASLDDCEIIKGGYGIKESGSTYPTKSAMFSEHKSDCEHVGCHINGTKRWCHKLQSEVPYEKCSDKCPGYSSKQKPVNKIEPKFQPGDWVVCEDDCSVHQIKGCFENLNSHTYNYELTEGGHISSNDANKWHLWVLEYDAKDGDILVSTVTNKPFIYNGSSDDTHVGAYCGINILNTYKTAYPPYYWAEKKDIVPATKEQRDFLFERMKEADYMWDFSNKKPVKIETK